jgi:4-amino-4-deoxy-L-arabinose transferase-like glycosyltransferase
MSGAQPRSRLGVFWLATIFVAALAARLGATFVLEGFGAPLNRGANPDQVEYEAIAQNLVTGHGYAISAGTPTAARPPGTPLAIALPYLIFGRSLAAARIWFGILSAATCLIVALLATRAGGRILGIVAGLWLAAYPGHLYYAIHLLCEPVFGFFISLAALLTVAALDANRRELGVAAGLCWAGSILTRVEFLLIFLPAAIVVWQGRQRLGAEGTRLAALIAAVAIVAASPWPVRNAVVLGKPVLSTQRGFVWWGAHNDQTFANPRLAGGWVRLQDLIDADHPLSGSEITRDAQAFSYGVEAIRRNWRSMPYLTLMKEWRLLSPAYPSENRIARWAMTAGWACTLPFVAIGLWLAMVRHTPDSRTWLVLSLPVSTTLLSAAVFYGLPRFRDAVSPAFMSFAALGLCRLAGTWITIPGLSPKPPDRDRQHDT